MRISTLASAPGAQPSVPGVVSVTAGWGPAPERQFRAVRYLGFACGTLAEGIVLPEAGATLAGEFLPLDYDALHPPAPLAGAEVREQGGLLLVELGGVRRLRRVVLLRSSRTRGGTLGVYRLDGDRPAAEPTVAVESGAEVMGGEMEAEHSLLDAPSAVGMRAPAGRAAALAAPVHEGAHAGAHWVRDTVAFDLPDAFDDARFALGVTHDGAVASLGAGDLLSVGVQSEPVNPRLGLARPPPPGPPESDPDPLADLLLLWPDPSSPAAAPATELDAGDLLRSALSVHLPRRAEELRSGGSPLPARLDVALVVVADAPCRLRVDALAVDYHLERAGLEPREEKAVLRFPPDRVEAREVSVTLPPGAHVVSAQVEASASRVGGTAGGGAADAASALPLLGGLAVAEAAWAAQRLELADAVLATGLGLGLLPMASGTVVLAEVRADADGAPTGRRLGGGAAALGPVGEARWTGVRFGEVVLLPSGPVWVCLCASRGRAAWLSDAGGTGVEAAAVSGADGEFSVLRGAEAFCGLTAEAAAGPGAGLGLEIAGRPVTCAPGEAGRLTFDAATALEAAAAQGGSGPATAPLRFTAAPGTLLTVYPPRVVYDL